MNSKEKLQIIQEFLRTLTGNQELMVADSALEDQYQPIAQRLDWLADNVPDILTAPDKTSLLHNIIKVSCKFENKEPYRLQQFDHSTFKRSSQFWNNDLKLRMLPGCDYYARQTTAKAHGELAPLIQQGRDKLGVIIKTFDNNLDINSHKAVQNKIANLQKLIKKAKNETVEERLQEQCTILEDLNKINNLNILAIPQEDGTSEDYCTLAEAAGGVTEKVSLIRKDDVTARLNHLLEQDIGTLNDYSQYRDNFKLSTQAIIKLPKHGNVLEVQREAMALNFSRLLNLETSKSTMLTHAGKPALFVPFDKIRLLSDVATGKSMQALLFSFAKYSHYSTLNPVGEGLESERFIEDFGKSLGLFYLCSDTDAIGGYNQNKAIKGNKLFIFDQVMMLDDKLGLDSRLSMEPVKFLTKHTRHDQGRNRTLIEDSNMDNKFDALMDLKNNKPLLIQHCNKIAYIHDKQLKSIETQLQNTIEPQQKSHLKQQQHEISQLKTDALLLRQAIIRRIDQIDKVLPKFDNTKINSDMVKKTLILEKTLNNPILFKKDGRPYRNPWTQRNSLNAVSIEADEEEQIHISFNQKPSPALINMLNRHGLSTLNSTDFDVVVSKDDLLKLTETSIYPEQIQALDHEASYLNLSDLNVIKDSYGKAQQSQIMAAITDYSDVMQDEQESVNNKLLKMDATEAAVNSIMSQAKDQGFAKHVLKKLQCDMQVQLQTMIQDTMPDNMQAAFMSAKKLDRMSDFNKVVRAAIVNRKTKDDDFTQFLNVCLQCEQDATDHFRAQSNSKTLQHEADATCQTLNQLKQPQSLLISHQDEDRDDLFSIDPLDEQHEQISLEQQQSQVLLAEQNIKEPAEAIEADKPLKINI